MALSGTVVLPQYATISTLGGQSSRAFIHINTDYNSVISAGSHYVSGPLPTYTSYDVRNMGDISVSHLRLNGNEKETQVVDKYTEKDTVLVITMTQLYDSIINNVSLIGICKSHEQFLIFLEKLKKLPVFKHLKISPMFSQVLTGIEFTDENDELKFIVKAVPVLFGDLCMI